MLLCHGRIGMYQNFSEGFAPKEAVMESDAVGRTKVVTDAFAPTRKLLLINAFYLLTNENWYGRIHTYGSHRPTKAVMDSFVESCYEPDFMGKKSKGGKILKLPGFYVKSFEFAFWAWLLQFSYRNN